MVSGKEPFWYSYILLITNSALEIKSLLYCYV